MTQLPSNVVRAAISRADRKWSDTGGRGSPEPGRDAFTVDALMPEEDGVSLDYRDYDGRPMRTHFRFTQDGKIRLTACAPIQTSEMGHSRRFPRSLFASSMARKNIPNDREGRPNGDCAASRQSNEKASTRERRQVVQDYIDAVKEFAKSILRKMN
jgi:hypothetical protein